MPECRDCNRRRILFLTPQLPYPPEQGTAIRNYNLIAQVAQRHDVALLSFINGDTDSVDAGPLGRACFLLRLVPTPGRSVRSRLQTLATTSAPDIARRLLSPDFGSALQEILQSETFDTVQIEGLELAPYGQMIRNWLGERAPAIVFDDHNAEYVLQRRAFQADRRSPERWPTGAYSWIQWHRLKRYERQICRQSDAVLAVSDADAQALKRLDPRLHLWTIPNGVDVVRYHPGLGDPLSLRHPAVVFTGKMDFRPNVDAMLWFHRQTWPLIVAQLPRAHLFVVGKDPHPRLAPLRSDPTATVTGYVPDILPYFGGADVYIVPLRIGSGTRLKVLEAMSAGVPLVSTTLGAEGIGLASGRHALLADSPTDFGQAVISLLQDPKRGERLGRAARQFVLEHYDWCQIARLLEPVYDSLCPRES